MYTQHDHQVQSLLFPQPCLPLPSAISSPPWWTTSLRNDLPKQSSLHSVTLRKLFISNEKVLLTPKTIVFATDIFDSPHPILSEFPLVDFVLNLQWYLYYQTSTKEYKTHMHAFFPRENSYIWFLVFDNNLPKLWSHSFFFFLYVYSSHPLVHIHLFWITTSEWKSFFLWLGNADILHMLSFTT